MIFVVLGTSPFGFERLVRLADDYAARTDEEVFIQTGYTRATPLRCGHRAFLTREEYLEVLLKADVVLSHAGMGVTLDSLRNRKRLVYLPRLARLKEHSDDHQSELARRLEAEGRVKVIKEDMSVEDVISMMESIKKEEAGWSPSSAKEMLIGRLSEYVRSLK